MRLLHLLCETVVFTSNWAKISKKVMKTGEGVEESAHDRFMDEPIGTYKSPVNEYPVNESIETIDTDEHIFV
jgi:hypothetical protein